MTIAILLAGLIFATGAITFLIPSRLPVTKIESRDQWNTEISMSRTVLFVDADFNGFTNQGIYEPFCRWFHRKYGRDTLVIDTTPGEGEPWEIAQEIWRDHHVFTGGYKTFGGAGQVVWIDRGVVIDNAFIMDFVHLSELQSRTEKVFE